MIKCRRLHSFVDLCNFFCELVSWKSTKLVQQIKFADWKDEYLTLDNELYLRCSHAKHIQNQATIILFICQSSFFPPVRFRNFPPLFFETFGKFWSRQCSVLAVRTIFQTDKKILLSNFVSAYLKHLGFKLWCFVKLLWKGFAMCKKGRL